MVDNRVTAFFADLKKLLRRTPGNVAISCHNNSIRPLRRVFEQLSVAEMCRIESRQDEALVYHLILGSSKLASCAAEEGEQSILKFLFIRFCTFYRIGF
jgi:bisphosphoglycerate-dependent phosphoglycerate mutase